MLTLLIVNNNRHLIDLFPLGAIPSQDEFHLARTTWNLIQPTEKIIKTTLPMGMFQFVGHITSHQATSLIPVSLVHSVKALSPLTTVFAYRTWYDTRYPTVTYLTLLPLMFGVIMTCFGNNTATKSADGFFKGLFYAFISMIIFVSQNIFAKKILTWKDTGLPTETEVQKQSEKKIDKITILLYCSLIGFALTLPIYIISEFSNETFTLWEINTKVFILFLLHGASHFMQAMLAFHLIGLVSPVNYSIANILKRIVVIAMALVWERQSVNMNQGLGLLLTMAGLYAYDRWGMVKK
jgi:solute carrier family 35 protein E1